MVDYELHTQRFEVIPSSFKIVVDKLIVHGVKIHGLSNRIVFCDGDSFSSEIDFLTRNGWLLERNSSAVTLLIFDISCFDSSRIEANMRCMPHLEFCILRSRSGAKKTSFLSILEKHGFRISIERGGFTLLFKTSRWFKTRQTGFRLDSPEVVISLEKSKRRLRNLPSKTPVDFVSVEPSLLLTPDRFDIAIKALYARLWRSMMAPEWREYAYYEHVLRITGPDKAINEFDGSGKSGIGQFQAEFHKLLSDSDPKAIPLVPFDSSWCVFDGAHRVASAIVTNRILEAVRIEATSSCRAHATFFSGRTHGHSPCSNDILDEAAIEYCRIKDGLVMVFIFPTVASEKFAIDTLRDVGEIVYRKDVVLSPKAGAALLRQAYLGHEWFETVGEDSGFLHKVQSCFPFRGVLRAILVDNFDARKIRATKERIRSHYGLGNHSIHFTDGDDEVLRMARVLFNENSLDLLELGLGKFSCFHQMLFSYRDWLEENKVDVERFCVDGSAVLALIGLRECRDLDFLFHGEPITLPATPKRIDCHNSQIGYYSHSIGDLVGDPRLHCWYMGVKFCTPEVILKMKQCRREIKDLLDVALLQLVIKDQQPTYLKSIKINLSILEGRIRANIVRIVFFLKVPIRPIWKAIRRYCGSS